MKMSRGGEAEVDQLLKLVKFWYLYREKEEEGPGRRTVLKSLLLKEAGGRPKKNVSQEAGTNDDQNEGSSVHVDENHNDARNEEILTELRIIGSENILSKIFVSEAMTCDDSIEPHLYDILESDAGVWLCLPPP